MHSFHKSEKRALKVNTFSIYLSNVLSEEMNDVNRLKYYRNIENSDNNIFNALKLLKDETTGLYLPKRVPVINEIPKPLEFYRNWVATNIPVLIKGGIKNWKAFKVWNKEYLCEKLKDKLISVAVTPNGYADAIKEVVVDGIIKELFVLPEERLMTMLEFYKKLETAEQFLDNKAEYNESVFYIQKQNSNLTEEFPELLPDIDSDLLWASESFNSKPTAINLWIGDQRAITSLHKDPFENIYCVISGCKEFILLPPTDRPWLPYKTLSVGQYFETSPGSFTVNKFESDSWKFKMSETETLSEKFTVNSYKVPWIAVDPSCPDYEKYPLYCYASPLHVQVESGDILYLPSLWFHYVKQSHKCIAINYWYEMNLDIKYAYFQLIDKLAQNLES